MQFSKLIFIVGYFKTNITTLKILSTQNYLVTSEKNSITEQVMKESALIHSNYVFAGLGVIIVLLVFGTLIHLVKKSRSLERRLVIKQTCHENDETTHQTQQIGQRGTKAIFQEDNIHHFYRPIESKYDEISENLEMHMSSEEYDIPNNSLRKNDPNNQTKDVLLTKNISDHHSQSPLVPELQALTKKEERNVYLEVIQ